jgi:hypothetical protein
MSTATEHSKTWQIRQQIARKLGFADESESSQVPASKEKGNAACRRESTVRNDKRTQ